jgi:hypothetical protein
MPEKRERSLARRDEPSQTTEQGLEIPVPERSEVMDLFSRAAKKRSPAGYSSRSARGKRRTSRDAR